MKGASPEQKCICFMAMRPSSPTVTRITYSSCPTSGPGISCLKLISISSLVFICCLCCLARMAASTSRALSIHAWTEHGVQLSLLQGGKMWRWTWVKALSLALWFKQTHAHCGVPVWVTSDLGDDDGEVIPQGIIFLASDSKRMLSNGKQRILNQREERNTNS